MKITQESNVSKKIHELQITIDNTEGYAEIIEISREGKDGPGFVVVTTIKAIAPTVGSGSELGTSVHELGE